MNPPRTQNGPGGVPAPTRAENSHQAAEDTPTVAHDRTTRHAYSTNTLDRAPAAFASIYAPCPGRTRWLAVYVCPHCSLGHAGYAREAEAIPGLRRSRCGRRIWLVVARTYRGQHSEVAA